MRLPTQGDVLRALSKGHYVMVEHINDPPSASKKIYRLSSDSRTVRADLIRRLLRENLIAPSKDGFEFGEAQTYVLGEGMNA